MTVFFKDGREVVISNAVKASAKGDLVHFVDSDGNEIGAFNTAEIGGYVHGQKGNAGAYDARGYVEPKAEATTKKG